MSNNINFFLGYNLNFLWPWPPWILNRGLPNPHRTKNGHFPPLCSGAMMLAEHKNPHVQIKLLRETLVIFSRENTINLWEVKKPRHYRSIIFREFLFAPYYRKIWQILLLAWLPIVIHFFSRYMFDLLTISVKLRI